MIDFSQSLTNNIDTIIQDWVTSVRLDRQIETANHLTRLAIQDHVADLLQAMVTVLSQFQHSNLKPIVEASFQHGFLRAEQGFDPEEVAREYKLLRDVIFTTLEPELLQGTAAEVMRAMRLIDVVIDEALAQCFKSYVQERLQELQQLQSSLTEHNQELSRLVREHQENLSHLAHELKNPLTSIIGYSDLFLRQHQQDQVEKDTFSSIKSIERVLQNGKHLLRLINDALEISRYEAGHMELSPEVINVREAINNVWEMLQPLADAKKIIVTIDCDRAPEKVYIDLLRLQQIITNLLSNAIRYTTTTGSIKLSCEKIDRDHWAIVVVDNGMGIEEEDQARIFDPYFRVNSNNADAQSTGLGLAIVSRLVKLLEGEIEVISKIGDGSTFTVILPQAIKNPYIVS